MFGILKSNGKVLLSKTKKDGFKIVEFVERPNDEYVFDHWVETEDKYTQSWFIPETPEIEEQ